MDAISFDDAFTDYAAALERSAARLIDEERRGAFVARADAPRGPVIQFLLDEADRQLAVEDELRHGS